MIILVSDHAGYELKNQLLDSGFLDDFDSDVVDLNTEYDSQDDYPDVAESVAMIPGYKEATTIGLCGSGQGICMALNRVGVRSGFGYSSTAAELMRLDNNANGICFSARQQSLDDIKKILKQFFATNFSDEERHQRRVKKLDKLSKISE